MRRARGNSGFLRATKLSTPLLHPGSAFNRSFLLAELRMYLHLHIYGVSPCISSSKVRGSSSFHPLGVSLIFSILRFYPSFLFIIFSFGIGSVYPGRSPVFSLFRFYRATSFDEIKLSSTVSRGNFERRPVRANGCRLSVCPSTTNYRKMEEELISIGNRARDSNAPRSRLSHSSSAGFLRYPFSERHDGWYFTGATIFPGNPPAVRWCCVNELEFLERWYGREEIYT